MPDAPAAMRPLTASFVDPQLESEFLADNFEVSLKTFTRFSITLSVAAFLLFGIHDAFAVPTVRAAAWSIRYGIFGPVAAAVLLVTHSRHLARFHQATMLVFGMALNVVVMWIGAIAPVAGYFTYMSYAVIFTTLGPFIARMNVRTQSVFTALSLALYVAFEVFVAHSTLVVRLSVMLNLVTLGGIGALVAYQLERQARQSFLQRRIIQKQIEELDAEKTKSEALLLNVLPVAIANRLKAQNSAIADGFADVTVLFLDIVGFTKMSARLTPEELVRRLNAIFSIYDDLAEELRVEKIKTIGDAYMAVCGLSTHPAEHASVMAEMALRMREKTRELAVEFGEPLDVRIGMNTGPVVAGVIGKKKFIYDVWGDTVNTASRMESHSSPGVIQVTEATYARLKDTYELESRGELEVKGKGAMVTYALGKKRR